MKYLKGLGLAFAAAAVAFCSAAPSYGMPSGAMQVIGKANPPIGHYEFCKTYVSECAATYKDAGPLTLTEDNWQTCSTSTTPSTHPSPR